MKIKSRDSWNIPRFLLYVAYNDKKPTEIPQARWNAMLKQVDNALAELETITACDKD